MAAVCFFGGFTEVALQQSEKNCVVCFFIKYNLFGNTTRVYMIITFFGILLNNVSTWHRKLIMRQGRTLAQGGCGIIST